MIHFFVFVPMLASLLLLVTPVRWREEVAAFAAAVTLALGVLLWRGGGADLVSVPWIAALGVTYSVALDGVSLLLALVTALMTLVAVVYTARRIPNPVTMLSLILAMETGLLGIYAARDLVLFYVFFEDALIPALLMLAFYGKTHRMAALVKFGAYTLLGSMLMLVSIIGVKAIGGSPTFALPDLLRHPVTGAAQTWLYLGFLAAMAVKLPLFPLHAWLPDFHEQNHDSGVADVMGTLYKVGAYGLFRFGMTLFPDASLELRPLLMGLAAFTAIYAAWIAFRQSDWKRLLAYAGLSHMGLVGLGIFSLQPTAMTGALYLLAFQNVYTGALFLAAGMLQERVGSLSTRVGGVMIQAPILSGVTMSLWFASIAVPGLAGFIGEFSVLLGAYQVSPWLAFAAGLSTIAAAVYALSAYQTTYWQARPAGAVTAWDLRGTEWLVLGVPLAVCVVFGVYSGPALHLIQPVVRAILGGGA
ncbi:NADH-quinone oxidoreductase subunit M [Deinococcus aquiradiocola]|uniref:NADH dehydrogenase subunit M n=1 Tax=Deinococcus aquiradiocola TaxID=393059 RepID=A0A917P5B9_9DEIO|nr:NADH-quinone oxidoreductase subunit M [Deinococcus aquiradiocola]GGJ62456.1 NADH dehydrogenase subunit M [Deinococcus aquiradiocola]